MAREGADNALGQSVVHQNFSIIAAHSKQCSSPVVPHACCRPVEQRVLDGVGQWVLERVYPPTTTNARHTQYAHTTITTTHNCEYTTLYYVSYHGHLHKLHVLSSSRFICTLS